MGLKSIQLRWWLVLILILVPLLLIGCNRAAPEPEGEEVAETTVEESTTEEQTMPTEEEGTAATEGTTAEETTVEETTAEETTAEETTAEETTAEESTAEETAAEETAAEETTAEETATEETAPATEQSYVILPGDTLFSIGQTYGVSVEEIAARNSIINVHQIEVGATIIIPTAGAAAVEPEAPSAEEGVHVVKAGENLFRISLSYNMSFETVAAYNGIPWPYHIHVGQEIKIPPAP